MAFYHFFGSTGRTTTSVTMFGTLGPWAELPDGAPPILWIDTTSAAGANQGLYVFGATTVGTTPGMIYTRVQITNYEPGTRWFLPSDCGVFTNGTNVVICSAVNQHCLLYYRSIAEGPDPNRMQ